MHEYLLPDVGEGLVEAEIVSWKVKVGDVVAVNDVIVEIETAKSLVELPTPYAGTVLALLVPQGETVAVGTPIVRIGEESEASAEPVESAPATPAPEAHQPIDTNIPPEGNPTLVGYGPREVLARRRARKGSEPAGAVEALDEARPTLAKPPVRKLARDLGVDLATVTATGPQGSVSRADVEQAAGSSETSYGAGAIAPEAHDVVPRQDVPGERREPIKGVRKMMGQAMVDSAFTAPHVTEWVTVDVTRTMEFVQRLKADPEFKGVKVSPLLVLARAVVLAMRRTPEINSFWDEAAQEVVFKSYVNLGIAAATPRGLVVPNIKDAHALSVPDLARALEGLIRTAKDGRTQPAEMSGGTFTITNVGVFGIDAGTPIINPGESAILCFGAVRKQPWVVTDRSGADALAIRQVTTLAMSFDHRHIDGEKGSRFLADLAGILEDPAASMLF